MIRNETRRKAKFTLVRSGLYQRPMIFHLRTFCLSIGVPSREHVFVIYSSLRSACGCLLYMPVTVGVPMGVGNFMHVRLLRPASNQSRLCRKTMTLKLASISQYKCACILNLIGAKEFSMKFSFNWPIERFATIIII